MKIIIVNPPFYLYKNEDGKLEGKQMMVMFCWLYTLAETYSYLFRWKINYSKKERSLSKSYYRGYFLFYIGLKSSINWTIFVHPKTCY